MQSLKKYSEYMHTWGDKVAAGRMAPVNDLRVDEIDTAGGLEALKPLWDGLLAVCPHRTPFLTHEWTTNWWKHFGKGKGLSVLVVHENGRPVLIAPLMKYAGRVHGGLPIPALIIESIANYHSNRADFIFEHGRPEYFQSVWDHLRRRERWHLLRLYPVPDGAAMVFALRSWVEGEGIHAIFTHSQTSPFVPIPDRRSPNRAPKNVSRSLRRSRMQEMSAPARFPWYSGHTPRRPGSARPPGIVSAWLLRASWGRLAIHPSFATVRGD